MALEGALVLPLFLLFLFTVLYSLEIVRFQSDLYAAVHQSGSKICFYSYQDKFAQEESGNNAGTAKGEIRDRLEKEILPFLCVEKGREGVVIHVEKTGCQDHNRLQHETLYLVSAGGGHNNGGQIFRPWLCGLYRQRESGGRRKGDVCIYHSGREQISSDGEL